MFFEPMAVFSPSIKYSFPHILHGSDFSQDSCFWRPVNLLALNLLCSDPFFKPEAFTPVYKNLLYPEKRGPLNIKGASKN